MDDDEISRDVSQLLHHGGVKQYKNDSNTRCVGLPGCGCWWQFNAASGRARPNPCREQAQIAIDNYCCVLDAKTDLTYKLAASSVDVNAYGCGLPKSTW